ncbi:pilus assembly protein TadG-related protein [Sphingopyxis sp.]|uniref:pilus assembly protein TadG-related protein n=1 Tax=Sphingopyxis sp. TaxID=1908224 RepID=UPI0035ADAED2
MARCTNLLQDRRGAISVMSAVAMSMLIGATALAVDIGSFYLDRRKLQGIADAAALAAAGRPGQERAAAERIIAANCDCNIVIASLTSGTYQADPAIQAEQRFSPGRPAQNAVRIVLTRDRPMFFGRFLTGRDKTVIGVSATGARQGYAAFSLGSRVAALHGGVPNALLSSLTGSQVNLSVMDYNALAGADVDLLAFSDALRTQLNANVLTFGQTLDTQATLPQVLSALAASTDGQASAALSRLATGAVPKALFPSRAIDLGPRSSSIRVDEANPVKVNAMSLLRSMLLLANANRQIDLSVASSLPGGSGVNIALLVGEPPADSPLIAITDTEQVIVRTAQVRLKLAAKVALPLASVEIPVYAELGSAAARITDIDCTGGSGAVTLGVKTSPATLMIGKVADSDFQNMQRPLDPTPAKLVNLTLANVEGKAELVLSDLNEKPARFTRAEIDQGTVKTVESSGLVAGAAKSLTDRIDLKVNILGLGLGVNALKDVVGEALGLAAPVLDGVLESLTGILGVHIGEADARVNALRCGKARLV